MSRTSCGTEHPFMVGRVSPNDLSISFDLIVNLFYRYILSSVTIFSVVIVHSPVSHTAAPVECPSLETENWGCSRTPF